MRAIILLLGLLLFFTGCASVPEPSSRISARALAPSSGLPWLEWTGDQAAVYFVDWRSFSVDAWIPVAGPLTFPTTNMSWETIGEGWYRVSASWPEDL